MGNRFSVLRLEMSHHVDLRKIEKLGDHRTDQGVISTNALLSQKDEVMGNGLDRCGENPGDSERVRVSCIAFDVKRFGCAARKTLAESLGYAVRAEGQNRDLSSLGFLEFDGFLEGELVVGRNDEL